MSVKFSSSQLQPFHKLQMPQNGDFFVNNKYTFEIGGKGKDHKQIAGVENSWIVKDNLETTVANEIPLWMIGLLY